MLHIIGKTDTTNARVDYYIGATKADLNGGKLVITPEGQAPYNLPFTDSRISFKSIDASVEGTGSGKIVITYNLTDYEYEINVLGIPEWDKNLLNSHYVDDLCSSNGSAPNDAVVNSTPDGLKFDKCGWGVYMPFKASPNNYYGIKVVVNGIESSDLIIGFKNNSIETQYSSGWGGRENGRIPQTGNHTIYIKLSDNALDGAFGANMAAVKADINAGNLILIYLNSNNVDYTIKEITLMTETEYNSANEATPTPVLEKGSMKDSEFISQTLISSGNGQTYSISETDGLVLTNVDTWGNISLKIKSPISNIYAFKIVISGDAGHTFNIRFGTPEDYCSYASNYKPIERCSKSC